MKLCGVCILTDDAPRLAAFYEVVLKEVPLREGEHFGFVNAQLAVYNPGGVRVVPDKSMELMFFVDDVAADYDRLTASLPEIVVKSPPQKRPWGAYSFWFLDPDGNTISFIEQKNSEN